MYYKVVSLLPKRMCKETMRKYLGDLYHNKLSFVCRGKLCALYQTVQSALGRLVVAVSTAMALGCVCSSSVGIVQLHNIILSYGMYRQNLGLIIWCSGVDS